MELDLDKSYLPMPWLTRILLGCPSEWAGRVKVDAEGNSISSRGSSKGSSAGSGPSSGKERGGLAKILSSIFKRRS